MLLSGPNDIAFPEGNPTFEVEGDYGPHEWAGKLYFAAVVGSGGRVYRADDLDGVTWTQVATFPTGAVGGAQQAFDSYNGLLYWMGNYSGTLRFFVYAIGGSVTELASLTPPGGTNFIRLKVLDDSSVQAIWTDSLVFTSAIYQSRYTGSWSSPAAIPGVLGWDFYLIPYGHDDAYVVYFDGTDIWIILLSVGTPVEILADAAVGRVDGGVPGIVFGDEVFVSLPGSGGRVYQAATSDLAFTETLSVPNATDQAVTFTVAGDDLYAVWNEQTYDGGGSLTSDKMMVSRYEGGGTWSAPTEGVDYFDSPPAGTGIDPGSQYSHLEWGTAGLSDGTFGSVSDFLTNAESPTCTLYYTHWNVAVAELHIACDSPPPGTVGVPY